MDVRKFLSNGLLQNSERDGNSLEIFGTCGDMNIDGLESRVVDDWGLRRLR
jgi:hypothetical protein